MPMNFLDSLDTFPCPYGPSVELNSKISEVDRAYFSVLSMDFSLHHETAEMGYYYDCECENIFNFERFQTAAQHFVYYRRNKSFKRGDKVRTKYVDLTNLVASKALTEHQTASIISSVKQEFDFLSRVSAKHSSGCGLVDVFMIIARSPLVFFTFMEKPDETLAGYLRRTSRSSFSPFTGADPSNVSVKSQHWKPNEEHIPLKEAKFILCKVATTVLRLHRSGIIHGSLTPSCIFIFRRIRQAQSTSKKSAIAIESVKLANFAFAKRIAQIQGPVGDSLRALETNAMHEIAIQVAENTAYTSPAERNAFIAAVNLLNGSSNEVVVGQELPERTTYQTLECFVKLMSDV